MLGFDLKKIAATALLICFSGSLASFASSVAIAAEPAQARKWTYNRDVRPILAENCFACHGPDSAARKADLRLDKRQAALDMSAFVPNQPDDSEIINRIETDDDVMKMPPPKTGKKLKPEEAKILREWVAQGAEYEAHWSYIAPTRPALPAVKDEAWVRNPIDRFILSRLEQTGLTPAPEADRRALIRRVTLDLTGLPPTAEEVEAFVNDRSPGAYEKLVHRLLESKRWGEHRGRYWLDAARYADTHGIHFDNFREMWSYRDWVINAFNRNVPFDRFTIEQLAGDLLPNPTLDQRIATGFNRCNMTTNEGGVIPEEYLVHYTRDRTETTSAVWMGTTANCAVCHDHKFDPLSQKEFYQLAAFFNNSTQGAMDGNIKDTPPIMTVPLPADRMRWNLLPTDLATARRQVEMRTVAAKSDFDKWLASAPQDAVAGRIPAGAKVHASLAEGQGETIKVSIDGAVQDIAATGIVWDAGHVGAKAIKTAAGAACVLPRAGDFEKDQAFTCAVWLKVPEGNRTGAIVARMDEANGHRGWDLMLDSGRLASHLVNKWSDDAIKVIARKPLKPNEWHHVCVTYDGSSKPDGLNLYINGQRQEKDVAAASLKSTIRTDVPLKVGQRNHSNALPGAVIQDLRLYDRALDGAGIDQLAKATRAAWIIKKSAAERTANEADEIYRWWLTTFDSAYAAATKGVAALEQEEAAIRSRGTIAHVSQEKGEDAMAFVLFRGDYDKRRDQVKPITPEALPKMDDSLPRNRLGFAKWLLDPSHPLTARVTVNRFWQEVFGTGLVRTSGDFGVTGELPSHPELLDWLAVDFRESGWDIKRFFRIVVTSATYRQAAATTPLKLEKDADNRLLSRGPRFRMDAEMIRDYALAASGLISPKIGGPSVRPYQPDGVWEAVAMIGSNTRDYQRDSGESLYRRSMYTFWKRAAPPASMDIFNAPNREICTTRRERTNTPLQALTTLNDIQFVEAARRLAEAAIKAGGSNADARIDFMTMRMVARKFTNEERAIVKKSLDDLLAHYKGNVEDAKQLIAFGESKSDDKIDAAELAAWTMLANELLNLDEVLNK